MAPLLRALRPRVAESLDVRYYSPQRSAPTPSDSTPRGVCSSTTRIQWTPTWGALCTNIYAFRAGASRGSRSQARRRLWRSPKLCGLFMCAMTQSTSSARAVSRGIPCSDAAMMVHCCCSARWSARRTGGGAWPPAAGRSRPPVGRSPLPSMQRRCSWKGAQPMATACSR